MWFWNGTQWQFLSLASPWWMQVSRDQVKRLSLPGEPPPTEPPLAVPEYLARIREKCD